MTVSAHVTPQVCTNADWSTIGVAIFADQRNFWHLALVKHPDVAFAPSGPYVLKPGADYRPPRPMSARLTASLLPSGIHR